jgi:predicted nuclease with TOPRIM domain
MSNADSEEVKVVVERGGVSVEKSFEPDDFPVPAIAFVIHSDREESTDIRIVDQVPDDVPAQDIGFHPKYGADFWSVEDGQIVFEREFEAGEEYTTVYGLRAKDTDDIQRFLTEPSIEGVEGEESVSDIIGGDEEPDEDEASDEAEADTSLELDDPLDADDEADPEPDEDSPAPAEASADDLDSAIATVDTTADEEAPETDEAEDGDIDVAVDTTTDDVEAGDGAAHAGGTDGAAPDDLAATLAAQIRAGEVAEEDLETLSEALGPDVTDLNTESEVPGHVEAKLDKLQSDVDEVAAYTAALEEFLDDAGTAEDLLTLTEEFDEVRASVERLEGTVDAVESDVSAVDERLEAVAETTDSLDDRVDSIETDVADLRTELEAMEDELGDDLADRVADVEAELDEMEEDIQTLDNLRQALAGD